jgi:3-phosphoshikimate 1-carboxyvinyltransferase
MRVPGDKSISHRTLICGALATGRSRIRRILQSEDIQSTAGVLRSLGVEIAPLGDETEVDGRGIGGLVQSGSALDCGNSGTTARLMAGVVAAHSFASRFVGDASLSRRPMGRVAKPLRAMGARVELGGERDTFPMTVTGGELTAIEWRNEPASAQVKSAILLAALCARISSSVFEPLATRDHTERMLASLGASIRRDGSTVTIDPSSALDPLDIEVPGDPSSAAFLVAFGVLGGSSGALAIDHVLLNPLRLGFLDALRRMGATLDVSVTSEVGNEPVGTIEARSSALRSVRVEAEEVPSMVDELPLLACVAARADGESVIRGAAELRVKESDRIRAVVENLRTLGVEADELPDGMRVGGTNKTLRGLVRTDGDHRIAMAFGVLGALPGNEITVDDPACVGISYPDFWRHLAEARA